MDNGAEVLEYIHCGMMPHSTLKKILEEFKDSILLDKIFGSSEKFKISENRYKFSDDYKISLVSDSGDIRHFYICDLVSLIGDGLIELYTYKKSDLMAKLNEYQLGA